MKIPEGSGPGAGVEEHKIIEPIAVEVIEVGDLENRGVNRSAGRDGHRAGTQRVAIIPSDEPPARVSNGLDLARGADGEGATTGYRSPDQGKSSDRESGGL